MCYLPFVLPLGSRIKLRSLFMQGKPLAPDILLAMLPGLVKYYQNTATLLHCDG